MTSACWYGVSTVGVASRNGVSGMPSARKRGPTTAIVPLRPWPVRPTSGGSVTPNSANGVGPEVGLADRVVLPGNEYSTVTPLGDDLRQVGRVTAPDELGVQVVVGRQDREVGVVLVHAVHAQVVPRQQDVRAGHERRAGRGRGGANDRGGMETASVAATTSATRRRRGGVMGSTSSTAEAAACRPDAGGEHLDQPSPVRRRVQSPFGGASRGQSQPPKHANGGVKSMMPTSTPAPLSPSNSSSYVSAKTAC